MMKTLDLMSKTYQMLGKMFLRQQESQKNNLRTNKLRRFFTKQSNNKWNHKMDPITNRLHIQVRNTVSRTSLCLRRLHLEGLDYHLEVKHRLQRGAEVQRRLGEVTKLLHPSMEILGMFPQFLLMLLLFLLPVPLLPLFRWSYLHHRMFLADSLHHRMFLVDFLLRLVSLLLLSRTPKIKTKLPRMHLQERQSPRHLARLSLLLAYRMLSKIELEI
mmetsp:Transcript_32206/g.45020  ORF Transcript_32206/g.45020 Transcript_32206/m.45020 type:complete len:216 (-) Transcript_32206:522-1169(-)